MYEITSQTSADVTAIELDGRLDLVSAHDLHGLVDAAIRQGSRRLHLDLSRVSDLDEAGRQGLTSCCSLAMAARVEFSMVRCSRPFVSSLRRLQSRQR